MGRIKQRPFFLDSVTPYDVSQVYRLERKMVILVLHIFSALTQAQVSPHFPNEFLRQAQTVKKKRNFFLHFCTNRFALPTFGISNAAWPHSRAGQPHELAATCRNLCLASPATQFPRGSLLLRCGPAILLSPCFVCFGRHGKSLAVGGMARRACLGRPPAVVASLHVVCFHPSPPGWPDE